MKKVHWKSFTLGIMFSIALAVGLGEVSAATTAVVKNLKVTYNNIKIMVDNTERSDLGKDSSGAKIQPFIYNGITYLPVRAVAEALGQPVNWDGKQNKVYIGKYPGVVDSLDTGAKPYKLEETYVYNSHKISGVKYDKAYTFNSYNSYSSMYANLQGKYTTLKFDLGTESYKGYVTSLMNIYLDDKLYTSIKVHSNELPKKITIPVKGVKKIQFETKNAVKDHVIAIGDPTLYVQ